MCVCIMCICVQLHKGSQIGPQKTPSDLSGLCTPMVSVCMWTHIVFVCVYMCVPMCVVVLGGTGALVLYGITVIRTTGGRPDRRGCVSVCLYVCVFMTPTFHLAFHHGCCDVTRTFLK